MSAYTITLINEKNRFYDRFAVFLTLICAAAVITFFFAGGRTLFRNIAGAVTLLILLTAIIIFFKAAEHSKRSPVFLAATIAAAIYWGLLGYWWAGVVTILLAVLYTASQKKPVVTVTEKSISYPSFPARSFTWDQLNNVLLKDGLLTIDLKNNRLIQQAVDEKITSVNEQNFNEFCRQQLSASPSV